ncbi:MAG: hypothetical protein A3A86_06710 [Elusimicrobia bacterium RIFCSPLOWO2_01_FULL_60_11]|nr:MAG: hypothetical protein A3A86_06710 [Elusimicrobia bacterium RIFCSPLOWO2_01_FULL_60_11]
MKKKLIAVILIAAAAGGAYYWKKRSSKTAQESFREVRAEKGSIAVSVLATGVVQPQNRLELKPAIAGRMEDILVQEGQEVKRGQVLAWLSSSERAALLDAARAQGDAELEKWKKIYRPAPMVAPMDGVIIARNAEPGQTAEITLDAYSKHKIPGRTHSIAFEAKTVNSVTIYEVDVLPDSVPSFMKSGMTANVAFRIRRKDDVLVIPQQAVREGEGRDGVETGPYVLVPGAGGDKKKKHDKKPIQMGLSDGKMVEVTEGLAEGETVLVPEVRWDKGGGSQGTNPFLPMRNTRPQQPRSGGR